MKLLFICNQGKHRSRTAAELYANKHETEYAGVYSEERPVTKELLEWAGTIFVMEEHQRKWLAENYPEQIMKKRVLTLAIEDVYKYNDSKLKNALINAMNLVNTLDD